jgi:hypothetical protein
MLDLDFRAPWQGERQRALDDPCAADEFVQAAQAIRAARADEVQQPHHVRDQARERAHAEIDA